jgi:hypothetical protein
MEQLAHVIASLAGKVSATLSSYELIVAKYRDGINYHAPLERYGANPGDGNTSERAKDMRANGHDNSVETRMLCLR